jgi:hypothetical protein
MQSRFQFQKQGNNCFGIGDSYRAEVSKICVRKSATDDSKQRGVYYAFEHCAPAFVLEIVPHGLLAPALDLPGYRMPFDFRLFLPHSLSFAF